ncbi:MAG: hypothetical protein HDQ87_04045 [Clostridia bacterium]|nr:hypothetical protein [Clostridia bacterium]
MPAETSAQTEPAETADLALSAEGFLDGMEYRYNSTWKDTSDPMTNAVVRTYEIDLGADGMIRLQLAAVKDEATSAAVKNLRTQSETDREAVIQSMIAAKDGTLSGAQSERAAVPPAGTRAMWSYEGVSKEDPYEYVHGYAYVGGDALYEVSAAGSEEAYAAFETAWKSLINQLKFAEIEPIETPTPEPTPAPTPAPTPSPAQQPVSSSVSTVEDAMQVISRRFGSYVGEVVFHDIEYSPENNYYYYHLSVAAWHPDGDYAYDNGEPGDVYGYLDADTGYIAVGDASLEEWAAYS